MSDDRNRHSRGAAATRALSVAAIIAAVAACAPASARSFAGNSGGTIAGGVETASTTPATSLPAAPVTTIGTGPVLILGDSLTVGIEPYLPSLIAGRRLSFDARVGRPTADGIAIVAQEASQLPGTVVIGLGTNDDPSTTAFAGHVDQMMALLDDRRVLWVNISRAGYEGFNAVLTSAAARYPNLEVVDWATPFSAHPEDQMSDGIHATEAGYRLRAGIIAAALG